MMKKLLSVLLAATLLSGSVTVFAAEKKPVARETLATFFTTGAEERVPGEIVTEHLVTGQPKVINHVVNAFTYDVIMRTVPSSATAIMTIRNSAGRKTPSVTTASKRSRRVARSA